MGREGDLRRKTVVRGEGIVWVGFGAGRYVHRGEEESCEG